jgi:hypothetical protein
MEIWKQAKELLAPTQERTRGYYVECKPCGLGVVTSTIQRADEIVGQHQDCSSCRGAGAVTISKLKE